MQIKICGMRDAQNIKELLALNPDFIGFIFYPASKRYITINEYLNQNLDTGTTKRVGIFVNEDIKKVISIATQAELNYIQLHGDENIEYCEELKYLDFKIIKAFGIDEHFDFQILNAYEEVCDYFLFDTKTKDYGGSGITFDWNILNKYTLNKKIFLSGGLNIEHIKQIKELSFADKIFALDFNSQLEFEAGLKDIKKCETLINAIHQIQ